MHSSSLPYIYCSTHLKPQLFSKIIKFSHPSLPFTSTVYLKSFISTLPIIFSLSKVLISVLILLSPVSISIHLIYLSTHLVPYFRNSPIRLFVFLSLKSSFRKHLFFLHMKQFVSHVTDWSKMSCSSLLLFGHFSTGSYCSIMKSFYLL